MLRRRLGLLVLTALALAAAPARAQGLTITVPAPYQTVQRTSATVGILTIAGTYTGSPTAIEASFNGGGFATIDAAPAGGTFSGTLTNQTPGQGTLTVRFTNDTGITDTQADVGIGDVFLVIGDSIAEGRGTNPQSYTHATLKATVFRQDDAWANGNDPVDTGTTDGSHWPLLATLMMADLGVPVAFITTGTGSTDVAGTSNQWAEPNSAYEEAEAQAAAATGRIKAVLAHLGPNAVVNATTISEATYRTALDTLAANLANDIAGAPPLSLALFGEVSTGSPPDRETAIANLRAAILSAWSENAQIIPGPDLTDLDYADGVHPQTDPHLTLVASRWWGAIRSSLYPGPWRLRVSP